MRLLQTAQLHWTGEQAALLPTAGCAACASPCAVGSQLGAKLLTAIPVQQLNLSTTDLNRLPGTAQPVAVTVSIEVGALNGYAALVFGLPLVGLFVLAAVLGSAQISTPAQVPIILLTVASMLLIVTALCRCVAQRFQSQLQLEICAQNPHKLG